MTKTLKRMYTLISHSMGGYMDEELVEQHLDVFSTDDQDALVNRIALQMADNIYFKRNYGENVFPYEFKLFINGYFAQTTTEWPVISLKHEEHHKQSTIDKFEAEGHQIMKTARSLSLENDAERQAFLAEVRREEL